jgi:hypothetical protein
LNLYIQHHFTVQLFHCEYLITVCYNVTPAEVAFVAN